MIITTSLCRHCGALIRYRPAHPAEVESTAGVESWLDDTQWRADLCAGQDPRPHEPVARVGREATWFDAWLDWQDAHPNATRALVWLLGFVTLIEIWRNR